MEKKLISEINRIHELMGINTLLVENGGWVKQLAARSPKAFDDFTVILKSVRRPGTDLSQLTPQELEKFYDDIELKLRYSGLEGDELESIMKELKNNLKIRRILTTTDDFLSDLLKYEDEIKPSPGLANLSKVKLSAEQIQMLSADVLARLISDPSHNLHQMVTNIDKGFLENLSPLISSGRPISNVDEIWDFIDDNLNQIVLKNVRDGNITRVDPKLVYNEIREYMRTFSDTKKALDGVESKNFPKRTKTIKYGDERMKVQITGVDGKLKQFLPEDAMRTFNLEIDAKFSNKYNELIDKPPSELTQTELNFIKGVDAQKQGKTTNLDILFDEIDLEVKLLSLGDSFKIFGQEYKWFERFYINVFRPLHRWWYANIETLYYSVIVKNYESSFDMFSKKFEESFSIALNQFINEKSTLGGSYMRELRDKLLKLTSVSTEGFNSLLEVNAELVWNSFKTNAVKQLISPDEIEKFNQFVAFIEKQETSFRSKAIKDLFKDGSKELGGPTLEEISKETGKKIKEVTDKIEKNGLSDLLINKILSGLRSASQSLFSFYLGGSFMRPVSVELYLLKRGYRVGSAFRLLSGRLIWTYVFFPALFAVIEAFADAGRKMENIQGKELIVDPDKPGAEIINFVGMYYVPQLAEAFTGSKVNQLGINLSQTGIPNVQSWADVAADAIPGYADKNIVTLLEVGATAIGISVTTQGELTPKEFIEQEAKNQANIVEVTEVQNINNQGQQDYDLAKQKDDALKKENKEPVYVKEIEKLQQNGLGRTINSVNRLKDNKFITKEDAEFIIKHLYFIPQLPLDFISMVRKKQAELISQAAPDSMEELKTLNSLFGDIKTEKMGKVKNVQTRNLGSVVLKIDGKTFLTVIQAKQLYSLPLSVYQKSFPTGQGVVWITPEFSDLKPGTERTYNSMAEFIKIYKK